MNVERGTMAVTLDQQVSLRTAYLIMYTFALRYWERGNHADELTDFIIDVGPVGDGETGDPAQIDDWLDAARSVLSHPDRSWASYGCGSADPNRSCDEAS